MNGVTATKTYLRVRFISQFRYTRESAVAALIDRVVRIYRSDSAYTAGLLLVFGLTGIFSSLWMRLLTQ